MKTAQRLGLLSLLLLGSSASAPEHASACSCVIWTTRQALELVSVEALDGGEAEAESAFWPASAQLVHGFDDSFQAEGLQITLNEEQP